VVQITPFDGTKKFHFFPKLKFIELKFRPGPVRGVFSVFQNTSAKSAATVKKAPNTIRKGAEREINTIKFWLQPALVMTIPIRYFASKSINKWLRYFQNEVESRLFLTKIEFKKNR
jgi:hypothetical protein